MIHRSVHINLTGVGKLRCNNNLISIKILIMIRKWYVNLFTMKVLTSTQMMKMTKSKIHQNHKRKMQTKLIKMKLLCCLSKKRKMISKWENQKIKKKKTRNPQFKRKTMRITLRVKRMEILTKMKRMRFFNLKKTHRNNPSSHWVSKTQYLKQILQAYSKILQVSSLHLHSHRISQFYRKGQIIKDLIHYCILIHILQQHPKTRKIMKLQRYARRQDRIKDRKHHEIRRWL